eukprot:jgi/Mesen1/8572/ME000497S07984
MSPSSLLRSPPRTSSPSLLSPLSLPNAGVFHSQGASFLSTLSCPGLRLNPKPNLKFITSPNIHRPRPRRSASVCISATLADSARTAGSTLLAAFSKQPADNVSTLVAVGAIFVLGAPLLLAGLTLDGLASAFLLGVVTWRAFGPPGFILVATYFVLVRMKQKEAEGIAEKRSGRRGPGSVWGSGLAGLVCGLLTILELGARSGLGLGLAPGQVAAAWALGFAASFCTKLSDTTASEIGKGFGRNTYLVTTFKSVPRGTEGAVSVEGTLAGLAAACLLAYVALALHLPSPPPPPQQPLASLPHGAMTCGAGWAWDRAQPVPGVVSGSCEAAAATALALCSLTGAFNGMLLSHEVVLGQ